MNRGSVGDNRRVAVAAAATFLLWNGVRLTASEVDACDAVIGLVEGRHSEADIPDWIRAHSEGVKRR